MVCRTNVSAVDALVHLVVEISQEARREAHLL